MKIRQNINQKAFTVKKRERKEKEKRKKKLIDSTQ